MQSALDQAVATASHDFVQKLGTLNQDPYVREAIWRLAIREIAWAMLVEFKDKYGVADQFEGMADALRDHKEDNDNAK